ncbi:unnamed protein product, partial [Polarella glacialis]
MAVKGLKKKTAVKGKKVVMKFTLDCQQPADDNIIEAKDFEKFLTNRIKVDGKTGNLGEKVTITREKSKIHVSAEAPFSKRYLKYLGKKYLKAQQLRDFLRIVAPTKTSYELRYFNINEDKDEVEGGLFAGHHINVKMYLESQNGVPWVTLCYIVAEVNYGGRVTDDKDVRLISALLKRYFNEGVLTDGYKLSPLDAYQCPDEGSLEEVREYIRGLPVDEDPQVFGLHSNAQITAQTEVANRYMEIILSVQPRISSSGGGGKRPEEVVAEMAQ